MLSIHYTGDVESVVLQRMSALSRNQASELWIKPVPELKYLNADHVARYRLIMRLFYENHSKMKYWLKTEDVFADVMAWGLLADYTEELCQRDLEVLTDNLHGESSVDVDLKRLDEALRRTRFDVSLEDCMHVLYPGEFISRRRQRETEVAAWDTFCAWAGARTSNPPLTVWWQALAGGSGPGYRAFRECWQEFLQRGDSLGWTAAIAALEALLRRPGGRRSGVRLPVFAAKTTGDAHGLDRSGLAGRMFFWGLVALREMEDGPGDARAETERDRDDAAAGGTPGPELDSDAVRTLYARFGLVLDDICSIVWIAGFPEIAEHPVALTLWEVERLTFCQAPAHLFVVENPSIFGTLLDVACGRPLPHPLVSSSGAVSRRWPRFACSVAEGKRQIRMHK